MTRLEELQIELRAHNAIVEDIQDQLDDACRDYDSIYQEYAVELLRQREGVVK